MTLALAIVVVVGFATLLEVLGLPGYAREVVRRNKECLQILQDSSLDDHEKESALQRHARRLFALLGLLVGGSLLAITLPLAGVWVLEHVGVGSLSAVLSILQRIDFLGATIVVGLLGYFLVRQFHPS